MFIQDIFAGPDATQCTKKYFTGDCSTLLLKIKNIITQKRTTDVAKQFYRLLISFNFFCTELILANSKYLLFILYIYCANWLTVMSWQQQIVRLLLVIHDENIQELSSIIFLNLEYQNIKMGRSTCEHSLFFSFMRLCSKSVSYNWIA